MPHAFKPLRREFPLVREALSRRDHFTWEAFNSLSYLLGGVLFVIGSVFFLPEYSDKEAIGSQLFVVGSILYLITSGHDLLEELHSKSEWQQLNLLASFTYIAGAVIFILGSVFFTPNVAKYEAGAWCFIFGSILFVGGAVINALQIFQAQTRWNMQAMLLVALCYCMGSTLFVVASIPYLFSFQSAEDEERIYRFLGMQYIVGSCFFLLGGAINWYRASCAMTQELRRMDSSEERQKEAQL